MQLPRIDQLSSTIYALFDCYDVNQSHYAGDLQSGTQASGLRVHECDHDFHSMPVPTQSPRLRPVDIDVISFKEGGASAGCSRGCCNWSQRASNPYLDSCVASD